MAYTKIYSVKSRLDKALLNVCNENKTNNGLYISSVNCQYQIAEYEFEFTRKEKNDKVKMLAFHAIQSFKKGELTADQAHEIGLETMKRMLKGEYEFVIATHVDSDCIHNHMVINSVNMINGKSFSREHDRKKFPAWKGIRQISDEICRENNLQIIQEI